MRHRIVVRGLLIGRNFPGHLDIEIEDGIVRDIRRAGSGSCEFGGPSFLIAPTLMDIQVNGGFGIDLQAPGLTIEMLAALTERLAQHGVSRWIPTIITGDPAQMMQNAAVISEARRLPELVSHLPGVHFEGPFISPEDGPRGAHPRQYVREPDLALFDALDAASGFSTLYTTIAPDQPGALELIRGLKNRKVTISLGHHNATAAQIHAAADAGAEMCTHLGNGAAPMMHRHNNPLWPQMSDDRLTASIIADGHHLPPDALQSIVRAKTPRRILLTSDAVHLAGLPPGEYALFDTKVELRADGKVCLSGTDLLAGSGRMLIDGVLHVIAQKAMSVRQAFLAASWFNLARRDTADGAYYEQYFRHFPPRVGQRADFLLVERPECRDARTWKLAATWANGMLYPPQ